MGELKTLITCTPEEFFVQANKIRKYAAKWLEETNIMGIRATRPSDLETIPDDASPDEMANILARNKEKIRKQAMTNISKMLDSILEEHPKETLELLGMCCFVEPKDVNKYPMRDYLIAFNSLINDEVVIGFFTSLVALVQTNTSNAPKA